MTRRQRWGIGGLCGAFALATLGLCLTSGCASVDYLAQSARGHVSLLASARPVEAVIADPALPEPLRERLRLSQRMRAFAVSELHLPDNDSYRRYAELHRAAAVWNVVAAPELSLDMRTWCFPLVGCIGYRGYFSADAAAAAAAPLREEGLDVLVYPVPAYSTLGWSNWAGGDPLLSTFVQWPEGELARLMFHELAHQVAYAPGDTGFNESFATAVERIGSARWLSAHASEAVRAQQAAIESRRQDFQALVRRYRQRFVDLYRGAGSDADKRAAKAALLLELRGEHATLKRERWGGFDGYDRWFAQANNAAFGTQAAYDQQVGDFERLFESQGRDFDRFYAEVRRLAALPREERLAALAARP